MQSEGFHSSLDHKKQTEGEEWIEEGEKHDLEGQEEMTLNRGFVTQCYNSLFPFQAMSSQSEGLGLSHLCISSIQHTASLTDIQWTFGKWIQKGPHSREQFDHSKQN